MSDGCKLTFLIIYKQSNYGTFRILYKENN